MSFLFDDFNGAGAIDATKWAYTGGNLFANQDTNFSQAGGVLKVAGGAAGAEAWAVNVAPVADYSVEIVIPSALPASGGEIVVGARMIAVTSYLAGYYLIVDYSATGLALNLQCAKMDGSGASVGTPGGTVVATGFPATVKLVCNGTRISYAVNGTEIDHGTSSEVAVAGRPYLYMLNATLGQTVVDSIDCVSLAPSAFWTEFVKTVELD